MVLLRKLLFPFALLYGGITWLRNYLFDIGILKSHTFGVPVIAVGNLSVGGTGKSPQIEYLIRLLSEKYSVATLSRGYKRQTSGFILADDKTTAKDIGDEPMQFRHKFPNITVAVDADRKNGIEQLLKLSTANVILLDDAFQHRKVRAGFYILLTAYNDLYTDDQMLPTGNLRENRSGAKRADVIIVTKCPKNISAEERAAIARAINPESNQKLFFTFIEYDDNAYSEKEIVEVDEIRSEPKVVVAGIAKAKPFFDVLVSDSDIRMEFADHHDFNDTEIRDIIKQAGTNKIITTEKDYMRLKGKIAGDQLFYLPIKSAFVTDQQQFENTILDYVGKSTGNS